MFSMSKSWTLSQQKQQSKDIFNDIQDQFEYSYVKSIHTDDWKSVGFLTQCI